MSFSIKIGIEENVSGKLAEAPKKIQEGATRGLKQAGGEIWALARELCPVRTGFLRSTIYVATMPMRLDVGARANYAAYVEFGTRRMAARPYIRPAIEANLANLRRALAESVTSTLGG